MKHGRLADFFFAGFGVVPIALMLGGQLEVAILVFVPLMLVACCCGMAEQIEDDEKPKNGEDAGAGTPPRNVPGLAFKRRETAEKQK